MTYEQARSARQAFPATPASLHRVRSFVVSTLSADGATRGLVADFELAVSELASNAIEHGTGQPLAVTVDCGGRWWSVSVSAGWRGRVPAALTGTWGVAGPAARSGRGLGIVRHLMDDVAVERSRDTLVVTIRRRRV